eukprot:1602014-Lingulodinium_polyedra.AAC.1
MPARRARSSASAGGGRGRCASERRPGPSKPRRVGPCQAGAPASPRPALRVAGFHRPCQAL